MRIETCDIVDGHAPDSTNNDAEAASQKKILVRLKGHACTTTYTELSHILVRARMSKDSVVQGLISRDLLKGYQNS